MTATNITELIWNDAICGVLRLCGANECELGHSASDYEKFRALCRAVPYLSGHPLPTQLSVILRERLGVVLAPSSKTCDRIWRLCAERLLEFPLPAPIPLPTFSPERVERNPSAWHKLHTLSVLDGACLLSTNADSWLVWETEMRSAWDRSCKARGGAVRFTPDAAACDVIPDPYHVEQALQKGEDSPVLTAQVFRFLAAELQKREMTLWLDTDLCGARILPLLAYAERSVGLPKLIWMCKTRDAFEAICNWQMCPHECEIRFAVGDGITDGELQALAQVYPIGRLWRLSDGRQRGDGTSIEIYECEKSLDL